MASSIRLQFKMQRVYLFVLLILASSHSTESLFKGLDHKVKALVHYVGCELKLAKNCEDKENKENVATNGKRTFILLLPIKHILTKLYNPVTYFWII